MVDGDFFKLFALKLIAGDKAAALSGPGLSFTAASREPGRILRHE